MQTVWFQMMADLSFLTTDTIIGLIYKQTALSFAAGKKL